MGKIHVRILLLLLLAAGTAACGGRHSAATGAMPRSACDTAHFATLTLESGTGILLKNETTMRIGSITFFAQNTAPLLIEIREVRRSEPNRLYPAAEMRALIEKPLRCAPAQRGFCTVELPAAPTARGDLFILFRAAPKTETGVETASDSETASGEAADSASGVFELPGLALCRQQSEGLFFAVESGGRISYSQVEGLEILPPYVSLAAGE